MGSFPLRIRVTLLLNMCYYAFALPSESLLRTLHLFKTLHWGKPHLFNSIFAMPNIINHLHKSAVITTRPSSTLRSSRSRPYEHPAVPAPLLNPQSVSSSPPLTPDSCRPQLPVLYIPPTHHLHHHILQYHHHHIAYHLRHRTHHNVSKTQRICAAI